MTTIKDVADYFEKLNPARIDQRKGTYDGNCPCCVGAHLARLLGVGSEWEDGEEAWADLVGQPIDESRAMLSEAGAGRNPFSTLTWPEGATVVFRRVADRIAQQGSIE